MLKPGLTEPRARAIPRLATSAAPTLVALEGDACGDRATFVGGACPSAIMPAAAVRELGSFAPSLNGNAPADDAVVLLAQADAGPPAEAGLAGKSADELAKDPSGPGLFEAAAAAPDGLPRRVIKGGSWLCAPNFCARYRPAARQPMDADLGSSHIGFRTVADAPPGRS